MVKPPDLRMGKLCELPVRLRNSYLPSWDLFYQECGHQFVFHWRTKIINKVDKNLVKQKILQFSFMAKMQIYIYIFYHSCKQSITIEMASYMYM